MKILSYSYIHPAPEFNYFSSQSRKLNPKILTLFFFFYFFLFSFFFFNKHNSKSKQRIQTIRTPNKCTTIKDLPFLGQSCMQAKIDELWSKNMHCDGFPVHHFVRNYTHNLKTKGGIRMFYLSNNCSTSGDISSLGQNCM